MIGATAIKPGDPYICGAKETATSEGAIRYTLEESQTNGSTFFQKDGQFWFWRHDHENIVGPFLTEADVRQAFFNYMGSQQAEVDNGRRASSQQQSRTSINNESIRSLGGIGHDQAVENLVDGFGDYRDAGPMLIRLVCRLVKLGVMTQIEVADILATAWHKSDHQPEPDKEDVPPTPLPMLLWCPLCHARHVDKGVFETKPHRDHSCQSCGLTWRPATVPTVGVAFLPGYKDAT